MQERVKRVYDSLVESITMVNAKGQESLEEVKRIGLEVKYFGEVQRTIEYVKDKAFEAIEGVRELIQ